MRSPFPALLVALVASLIGATGCAGASAPSRFYVLSASAAARNAPASTGPDGTLGVFPARMADYLDRPQIVTFLGENGVDIDEFNRWAEPLGAGITRVLAEELTALLPTWRVVPQPWDPVIPVRARVVLGVTAFGWDTRGEARLEATWAVLTADGNEALARGRTVLRRAATGPGVVPATAAASALVAQLAQEIAAGVKAVPPAKAATPAR